VDFKIEKKLCKQLSYTGLDLMKAMLQKDPSRRLNSNQCLNHHWFIKMKSKNEKKIQLNPRQRSLSTIVENSELLDLTQSFYHASSRNKQQQITNKLAKVLPLETTDNLLVDKEFEIQTPSLSDKVAWINTMTIKKCPSK